MFTPKVILDILITHHKYEKPKALQAFNVIKYAALHQLCYRHLSLCRKIKHQKNNFIVLS